MENFINDLDLSKFVGVLLNTSFIRKKCFTLFCFTIYKKNVKLNNKGKKK